MFVLSPGKNKVYDGINDAELLNGIKMKYFGGNLLNLAGKTQSQINATLYDATIDAAGSDDFMKKIKVKVGTAEVTLYSIADVELGSDLIVSGISNREGRSITVKVTGPINIGTKFATVENGKFKATSVPTATATPVSPTPIPTVPAPAAAPTATATPTPTSVVPGFEVVLVVTALLVVSLFVLYQYALIKQHSPRKFRVFETRNMK